MSFERLAPILVTLEPSDHPYLSGPWTPQHAEVNATDLEVIEGAIPQCGTNLRAALAERL